MLMAKRMRSVPQKLVGQLLTIWYAKYNSSLITEVADEPFAEFLERYLYRVQYCLKEVYPVNSQACQSKNLEQKFLMRQRKGGEELGTFLAKVMEMPPYNPLCRGSPKAWNKDERIIVVDKRTRKQLASSGSRMWGMQLYRDRASLATARDWAVPGSVVLTTTTAETLSPTPKPL